MNHNGTWAKVPNKDLTMDDLLRCIDLIKENPIEKFMRDNGFNPKHDKIVFPLGMKPQFEPYYPCGFPDYMVFSPLDDNDRILLARCDPLISPFSIPFDWSAVKYTEPDCAGDNKDKVTKTIIGYCKACQAELYAEDRVDDVKDGCTVVYECRCGYPTAEYELIKG